MLPLLVQLPASPIVLFTLDDPNRSLEWKFYRIQVTHKMLAGKGKTKQYQAKPIPLKLHVVSISKGYVDGHMGSAEKVEAHIQVSL